MKLIKNENGATAAEYALILGIIGAAVALAAYSLGSAISAAENRGTQTINNCGGGC